MQQKILYANRLVKTGREWSGVLFVREIQSFDPQAAQPTCVIEAVDMFFLNVGTSGFTESSITGSIAHFYQDYGITKAVEHNIKPGFIHSHHSMATNPSSTDTDEVIRLAPQYDYFVSLIVNLEGTYTCLIGYQTSVEETGTRRQSFKNPKGGMFTIESPISTNTSQTKIDYAKVELPEDLIDEKFKEEVAFQLTRPLPVQKSVYNDYKSYGGYNQNRNTPTVGLHYPSIASTKPAVYSAHLDVIDTFETFLEDQFGDPNSNQTLNIAQCLANPKLKIDYSTAIWDRLVDEWRIDFPDVQYPLFIQQVIDQIQAEAKDLGEGIAKPRAANIIAALKRTLATASKIQFDYE